MDQTDDIRTVKNIKMTNLNLAMNYFNSYVKNFSISNNFVKQKFFERMKFMQKIRNTLHDYGNQFKKIPSYLSDNEDRKDIFQIRNTC